MAGILNNDGNCSLKVSNKSGKNGCMKIPLHQIHRKNKLSTVAQESISQCQTGRTNQCAKTPR